MKYIQDAGTKVVNNVYIDRPTGKLYRCIAGTTSVNNDSNFKEHTVENIHQRGNRCTTIHYYSFANSFTIDISSVPIHATVFVYVARGGTGSVMRTFSYPMAYILNQHSSLDGYSVGNSSNSIPNLTISYDDKTSKLHVRVGDAGDIGCSVYYVS